MTTTTSTYATRSPQVGSNDLCVYDPAPNPAGLFWSLAQFITTECKETPEARELIGRLVYAFQRALCQQFVQCYDRNPEHLQLIADACRLITKLLAKPGYVFQASPNYPQNYGFIQTPEGQQPVYDWWSYL